MQKFDVVPKFKILTLLLVKFSPSQSYDCCDETP